MNKTFVALLALISLANCVAAWTVKYPLGANQGSLLVIIAPNKPAKTMDFRFCVADQPKGSPANPDWRLVMPDPNRKGAFINANIKLKKTAYPTERAAMIPARTCKEQGCFFQRSGYKGCYTAKVEFDYSKEDTGKNRRPHVGDYVYDFFREHVDPNLHVRFGPTGKPIQLSKIKSETL